MKKKLLFFASDYQIGLTFLLTEELKFLIKQPELDVMAIAGEADQIMGLTQQINDNHIPIIRINGLDIHRKFYSLAKQIHIIINDAKFSVIHVQNNWQLLLTVFIKYIYRYDYKIIYTIHGYRHNSFFKSIIAKRIIDLALFLFADIVFVASSEVKQKFWLIRQKCFVLYLGVEESFFNTTQPDFNSSHKNIIFAGQFRKGKNQELIIEAISKYIEKTGNTNFSLYLPGDGPLKDQCTKLVEHLHLQNNVIFPGQLSREEILSLYQHCQIAIVPTNSETFGHCIAEPFVMGLCVLSRNVGIANDIIINGENGLIFNNVHDLSLLLQEYLTNNSALQVLIKSAEYKKELFRWNTICSEYVNIIGAYLDIKKYQSNNQTSKSILYFASDYKIGLSTTLSEQARSISEFSFLNLICVGGDQEQEKGLSVKYNDLNIPLIRIQGLDNHKKFYHLAKELATIITNYKIEVVHIHNNWQLALIVFIKYFIGLKFQIIYSIHGYRHNRRLVAFFAKRIIGVALFLFADLVLAGSTELKKALPFIRKKCQLLIQGVGVDLFTINHPPRFEEHKNIVFAGQFREGKNQKDIIHALHLYTEQTGDNKYSLYLPGKGKLKQTVIDYANKLGLKDNVVFPGQLNRNQMLDLYKKCQIAIIPTNFETFGYCIAEPYVAGLCVFSKRTGIAVDIIEHEKTGFLFDDKKDLAKLLIKHLGNTNQLELIANNSFAKREVLKWSNINKRYIILIKELDI